MKKFLSIVLAAVLLLSVASLAGCGAKETLKFGLGVHAYTSGIASADADTNGKGEIVTNAAAVLLDKDGKIVKCAIDTMSNEVAFTSEGKFVVATEFKTKYEKGADYGMVAYGGAKKEWFEQVDAFTALVVGKTLAEVKALVAEGNKGTDEVVTAGCTIMINDFVLALEKAINAATDSDATADDTVKVALVSTQTGSKDATADAAGVNEVDTTVAAAVLNKDGKAVAMATDALQGKVNFDAKGVTEDAAGAITTKLGAKENYGMAQDGQDLNGDGTVKEWFEQADAFNAACVGKTATEIKALAIETGYGIDTLQSAGCTINVADLVKAAANAATIG